SMVGGRWLMVDGRRSVPSPPAINHRPSTINHQPSTIPSASSGGTRADYARADSLRARTQNKLFRAKVEPHWFAGNTRFWYRNDLPGARREFVLVDASLGRRMPAFDHARLAAALTKATGRAVTPDRIPIEQLEFRETEPI